jgi:hypothetical protein
MTRTVTVDVTAEDIATGGPWQPRYCPLALAIGRAVGGGEVIVGTVDVTLHYATWAIVALPRQAILFERDFDAGLPVGPFRFTLRVPE